MDLDKKFKDALPEDLVTEIRDDAPDVGKQVNLTRRYHYKDANERDKMVVDAAESIARKIKGPHYEYSVSALRCEFGKFVVDFPDDKQFVVVFGLTNVKGDTA